jgi:hypothetical protein
MILHRYLCRMRPPAPGSIPKRNLHSVIGGQIDTSHGRIWGMADYIEPLTDEEIEEYELTYAGRVYVEGDHKVSKIDAQMFLNKEIKSAKIALGNAERRKGIHLDELENLTRKIEILEWIDAVVLKEDPNA